MKTLYQTFLDEAVPVDQKLIDIVNANGSIFITSIGRDGEILFNLYDEQLLMEVVPTGDPIGSAFEIEVKHAYECLAQDVNWFRIPFTTADEVATAIGRHFIYVDKGDK